MTPAPIRHIGGQVIADHGPLGLAAARALAAFYRGESIACHAAGAIAWAKGCEARAETLESVAVEAARWRRAAGWCDPEAADAVSVAQAADGPRAAPLA